MVTSLRSVERDSDPARSDSSFLNRELSWLDFNERVLALAEDPRLPLLERVKFAAIFAGNLDEFYQVRVATLRRQQLAAPGLISPDGLDAARQLELIADRASGLAGRHAKVFTRDLKPRLARTGASCAPRGRAAHHLARSHRRRHLVAGAGSGCRRPRQGPPRLPGPGP